LSARNRKSEHISFRINSCKSHEIESHFKETDLDFLRNLKSRVTISDYSRKLEERATTFEFWQENVLVALCAVYLDSFGNSAYVTNFSVISKLIGKRIGSDLMKRVISEVSNAGIESIKLEVEKQNTRAMEFYTKMGFFKYGENEKSIFLKLIIVNHAIKK